MTEFHACPRVHSNIVAKHRSTEIINKVRTCKRPHSTHVEPSTNVFINYIPTYFTEDDLQQLCSRYGSIVRSKIMINLETGESKCFGFVRFAELSQAQAAIRGLNGMQIGQKQLLAKYAQSCERKEQISSTIYVKRLPKELSVTALQSIFAEFGTIIQITPHELDIDHQSWRCIIKYTNAQAATRATTKMNNQIVLAATKPIHVKYADESRMSNTMLQRTLSFSTMPLYDDNVLPPPEEMRLLPSFLLN